MKRALCAVVICLTLVGCREAANVNGSSLIYAHDDAHGVSCWGWSTNGAAIDCLPDSQVRR